MICFRSFDSEITKQKKISELNKSVDGLDYSWSGYIESSSKWFE